MSDTERAAAIMDLQAIARGEEPEEPDAEDDRAAFDAINLRHAERLRARANGQRWGTP